MGVPAGAQANVKRQTGRAHESLEELLRKHGVILTDRLGCNLCLVRKKRPAGDVYGDLGQCFFHRHPGVAVTADARLVTQGLEQRFSESDADILDGVMSIDLE